MRTLIAIAMVLGCSSDEPTGKTSHPSMPNQFEVGSTINAKYRVLKKVRDNVFVVEHVGLADRELTLIAPPPHSNTAEVERTPDGKPFVVVASAETDQLIKR